jgi:hypothetical protein
MDEMCTYPMPEGRASPDIEVKVEMGHVHRPGGHKHLALVLGE